MASSSARDLAWQAGYECFIPDTQPEEVNDYEVGSDLWHFFMEGWYAAKADQMGTDD